MTQEIDPSLQEELAMYGIHSYDEVALRHELEKCVETYTLIKLGPWPARRWKCHYRLMLRDVMHDAQSVPEAYALAILGALKQKQAVEQNEKKVDRGNTSK